MAVRLAFLKNQNGLENKLHKDCSKTLHKSIRLTSNHLPTSFKSSQKEKTLKMNNSIECSSLTKYNHEASTTNDPDENTSTIKTKIFEFVQDYASPSTNLPSIDVKKKYKDSYQENTTNDLQNIPFILQDDRPDLYNLIIDHTKGKDNRRFAGCLTKDQEVNYFINAVKEKAKKQLHYRYSLIPGQHPERFIPKGSPLIKIFNKCTKGIKFAEEIDKFLEKEKYKEISNNEMKYKEQIKKLRQKQDEIIVEDAKNEQESQSQNDKVFIYNQLGGGDFVSSTSGKTQIQKMDIVSKISEQLAYNNRTSYMSKYGYNYLSDPEFIFFEEIYKKKKGEEVKKKNLIKIQKKEDKKKSRVDEIIENTIRDKELLLNKIGENMEKIYNKYDRVYSNGKERKSDEDSIFQVKNFYEKIIQDNFNGRHKKSQSMA